MSDVLTKMKTRRSIRKYKPDAVGQELLDQIIEAGLYAASGKGQQAAIIIQVTKKELRDKISVSNSSFARWIQQLPSPSSCAASIMLPITKLPSYTCVGQSFLPSTISMAGAP